MPSPSSLGRALTGAAHLALRRNLRLACALSGRLLPRRPVVSGAPLPPPASPTAPACKRPMTAFPCPSRSHLHPLSHASHWRLSTGASRPSATRPLPQAKDFAKFVSKFAGARSTGEICGHVPVLRRQFTLLSAFDHIGTATRNDGTMRGVRMTVSRAHLC